MNRIGDVRSLCSEITLLWARGVNFARSDDFLHEFLQAYRPVAGAISRENSCESLEEEIALSSETELGQEAEKKFVEFERWARLMLSHASILAKSPSL